MEISQEQLKEIQRYWYLRGASDKEEGVPMQFVPDKKEEVYQPVHLSMDELKYIREKDYQNGKDAMLAELKKDAIHCKVFWYDGPLMDYTQEQQDEALERIGAHVDDKILLIILKDNQ